MPKEVFVPMQYETVDEGEFKGSYGFRCPCGRLLIIGKVTKEMLQQK